MKVNFNPTQNNTPKFGGSFNLLSHMSPGECKSLSTNVLIPNKASIKKLGTQVRITCPSENDDKVKTGLMNLGINFVKAIVEKAT